MDELHHHKKALGTSENKCGSKHEETTRETVRYNSPVDPTCIGMNTSVEPVRKSRQHKKNNTLVDPTKSTINAGAVVQSDLKVDKQNTG